MRIERERRLAAEALERYEQLNIAPHDTTKEATRSATGSGCREYLRDNV